MPSTRMLPVVVLALVAGVLQALRLNLARLVIELGGTAGLLGIVVPALSVVGILVSPLAIAAAGYLWGTDVDVAERWLALFGTLAAVAYGGFVVAHLLLVAATLLAGSHEPLLAVVARTVGQFLLGVGLVEVAFAGLGGAAIAQFRTETGNSNTAAT